MGIFDPDDEDWKAPETTLEDYLDWQVNLLVYQAINVMEFKSNMKKAIKEEREKWKTKTKS